MRYLAGKMRAAIFAIGPGPGHPGALRGLTWTVSTGY
jgi:hypothetical protein